MRPARELATTLPNADEEGHGRHAGGPLPWGPSAPGAVVNALSRFRYDECLDAYGHQFTGKGRAST